MSKTIKYGMVGGDLHAFIGEVHRKAIALNHGVELVAGCFSNIPEYNVETGDVYNIEPSRIYADYKDMVKAEAAKGELDWVTICTPNFLHYQIAKAFLEAGINVVCEKPLCFEISEAEELKKIAAEKNLFFVVTYAYTGYTMVKVAKELVARGEIGNIININGEYAQEWLIDEVSKVEGATSKLSIWRKDPKQSGISNCVGDIGTHLENMIHYVTGMEIKRVSALLDNYGQPLELNANMLVEYTNGVRGSYWISQIAVGHLNGFVFRIFGDKGAIEWRQESPDQLIVAKKGQAPTTLTRGTGYIDCDAAAYSRIPSGHPEGYHFGFSNIYKNFVSTLLKKKEGKEPSASDLDFPTVDDGIDGVKFVHAAVESSKNDGKWTIIAR